MLKLTLNRLSIPFNIAAAIYLSACSTTEATTVLPSPRLDYKAAATCTSTVSFDQAVRRTEDEKLRKKEMRQQSIVLGKNMGIRDVPCVTDPSGETMPYFAFEIPTGIKKRVVNAGALYNEAVIFAATVTTHDKNGGLIREFEDADYRRLGPVYGVQFSPRDTERYVLIKADPTLVGAREETVETGTQSEFVSAYGIYGYGNGGTNLRGIQRNFIRTYSYNGDVVVQTVFPKQKSKK